MSSTPAQGSAEFLVAEYQHLAESFWRSEGVGETRFSFFVTLLTASLAGLVALATGWSNVGLPLADLGLVWAAALIALAQFGHLTLGRLHKRDETTDEYKLAMQRVRDHFRRGDAWLEGYDPGFPPTSERGYRDPRKGGLTATQGRLNGGVLMAARFACVLTVLGSLPSDMSVLHRALTVLLGLLLLAGTWALPNVSRSASR